MYKENDGWNLVQIKEHNLRFCDSINALSSLFFVKVVAKGFTLRLTSDWFSTLASGIWWKQMQVLCIVSI